MSSPGASPATAVRSPGTAPKVSVAMVAYNQEKYIADAIQSVLMQETSFPYELVIGEDRSSDRTREIVLDFARQNADRVRLVLSDQNRGAWENFRQTLHACRGRYIALLDGDDYWTDPRKLQIQSDFLDAHDDFALCFHNARKLYESGQRPPTLCLPDDPGRTVSISDLLARNFIPTCSVMVRNGRMGDLPDWTRTLGVGDWPFHVLNALHGKIAYLPDVMGVFRIHDAGLWSGKDKIQRLTGHVAVYRAFRVNLDRRFRGAIQSGLSRCYRELSERYEARGDRAAARRSAIRAFGSVLFLRSPERKRALARILELFTPRLLQAARSMRGVH